MTRKYCHGSLFTGGLSTPFKLKRVKRAEALTSHAGFMEGRGCAGGEGRVDRSTVIQKEPHTLYTTCRTGITQRGAPVYVPCIHLRCITSTYDCTQEYQDGQISLWVYQKASQFPLKSPMILQSDTCHSAWFTWAPASSSSLTHWACPWRQASCSGVMESTATTLTEAPLWMRRCSWEVWPRDAALCTSVLSAQQPAGDHNTIDVYKWALTNLLQQYRVLIRDRLICLFLLLIISNQGDGQLLFGTDTHLQ